MAAWELSLPRGRRATVGARPLVVGIINSTPDSFSDAGSYPRAEDAIEAGRRMLREGADWLDVGGESTRPGAHGVPPAEQLRRLLPVIRGLREATDEPISVDTMSPEVGRRALEAGADAINDVSGCRDPGWRQVLLEWEVPVIIMHMKGTPLDMQLRPEYPDGVVPSVSSFFQERLETLAAWGVSPERTILDPGIGFGKRVQHNLELIRNIGTLRALGRPVYIGASRKGFIDKVLETDKESSELPRDRDLGTLIVNAIALCHGADFLRVHNVVYASALVKMFQAVRAAGERTDQASRSEVQL